MSLKTLHHQYHLREPSRGLNRGILVFADDEPPNLCDFDGSALCYSDRDLTWDSICQDSRRLSPLDRLCFGVVMLALTVVVPLTGLAVVVIDKIP